LPLIPIELTTLAAPGAVGPSESYADFVRATDHVQIVRTVFAMLVAGVVCLKQKRRH
jgi:hypothetical protein